MRARLLWLGSLALVGAWVIVFAVGGGPGYPYGAPMIGLGLLFSTFGFLIVRRRPDNRVGWLFLALGGAGAVALVLGQWSIAIAVSTASGTLMLVSESVRLFGFLGLAFLVLIYPTGHPPSRRWRWVGRLLTLGVALIVFETLTRPGPVLGTEWHERLLLDIENPIGVGPLASLQPVIEVLTPVAFLGFVGAVASIVFRFRSARPLERRQIKLFAFAAVSCFVFLLSANILLPEQMDEGRLGDLLWNAPIVVLPAAATAAILRHGLYDIDRIVSRTLSYAIVTGLLVGSYAGLVVLLQQVIRPATRGSDLAVATSTLIVAAAFVPVRRRVQQLVDRRFNRARYDAVHTIETFSARLRDEIDVDALRADLEKVVGRTMQPAHVSLWLRGTRP